MRYLTTTEQNNVSGVGCVARAANNPAPCCSLSFNSSDTSPL